MPDLPLLPFTEPAGDVPSLSGLRLLHVVQKYSSGVGSAIAQYTRSLPSVEHHLLSGTPVDAEGDLAEQADFTTTHRMSGGHLARVRRVREVVRTLQPDVVHAHSSHGGVYTRLAVRRGRHYVVYTPHCYAFERRDVPAPVRAAFWVAEALLAVNTSAFAACSTREYRLSGWPTHRAPRYLVPNIAPPVGPGVPGERPTGTLVAGGGRLSPQKDPAFFLACVQQLRTELPDLRAVWIGDGDPELREELTAGGVEVSGWLPRARTMDVLGAARLYLHSARWEGFPLMVAEAAALGVPTLVRRVPSFAELPTELTIDGPTHWRTAVPLLGDDAAAAANVGRWAQVLGRNTLRDQRAALADVYRRATPARPAG